MNYGGSHALRVVSDSVRDKHLPVQNALLDALSAWQVCTV